MIEDPRGSFEFEPVQIRPRRRRFDPLLLGVLAVLVALGVAIVKPWDSTPTGVAQVSPTPSAVVAASPTVSAPATPAPPSASPLDTVAILQAISAHDGWGLQAVTVGSGGYEEHWSPAVSADRPVVQLGALPPVVALGVTSPYDEVPLDVRVYRFVQDGSWAWLDAAPVASARSDAALLLEPPRIGGRPAAAWAPGDYRIDLLTGHGVLRLQTSILDDHGVVGPALPFIPPVQIAHRDPILQTQLPFGPFIVVGGVAQAVGGSPTAPDGTLFDAWLDRPAPSSATIDHGGVRAPAGVGGLGIALPGGSTAVTAGIEQLTPDQDVIHTGYQVVYESDRSDTPPYVIYDPIGTVWSPGIYRLSVSWTDATGRTSASWEVTVFPGAIPGDPMMLAAARAFTRFAGQDGLIEAPPAAIAVAGQGSTDAIRFLPFTRPRANPTAIAPVDCGDRTLDGIPRVLGIAHRVGGADLQVRVAIEGPDGSQAPVPVMSVTLDGLTIVRPARVAVFPAGTYLLTIEDGTRVSTVTACLGGIADPF